MGQSPGTSPGRCQQQAGVGCGDVAQRMARAHEGARGGRSREGAPYGAGQRPAMWLAGAGRGATRSAMGAHTARQCKRRRQQVGCWQERRWGRAGRAGARPAGAQGSPEWREWGAMGGIRVIQDARSLRGGPARRGKAQRRMAPASAQRGGHGAKQAMADDRATRRQRESHGRRAAARRAHEAGTSAAGAFAHPAARG